MKTLKKHFFALILLSLFLTLTFAPGLYAASMFDQISGSVKTYTNNAFGGGQEVKVDQTTFLNSLMMIVNYLLTFLGAVFMLGVIYAGFLWMNAKGNEEQINKAKEMLKQFIVGLIIILTSRVITEVILINIGQISA